MKGEMKMYLTRKEIYDQIWTRTVQGFAEERGLNYPMLLRRIREEEIPRPSRREIVFIRQGEDGLRAIHRPSLCGDPDRKVKLTELRKLKTEQEEQLPQAERDVAHGRSTSRTMGKTTGKTMPESKADQNGAHLSEGEVPPDGATIPKEAPELIDYEHHPRWSTLYFLQAPERRRVIRETECIKIEPGKSLHPTVRALQKEIAGFRAQAEILGDEKMVSEVLGQPALLERISSASVGRVLSILNSLYQSVEFLGGNVLQDGSIQIHGENVSLRFTESRAREAVAPSAYEELKEGKKKKWLVAYTGKLTLSIGDLYSIRDRKHEAVEERLGDALELLYVTAFQLSQQHAPQTVGAKQASFRSELERTEDLIQLAKDYEDAERIRTLIKAVQRKLSSRELEYEDCWPTWAAWASEKAEWLDPTVGRKDKALGRRHDPILRPARVNTEPKV